MPEADMSAWHATAHEYQQPLEGLGQANQT